MLVCTLFYPKYEFRQEITELSYLYRYTYSTYQEMIHLLESNRIRKEILLGEKKVPLFLANTDKILGDSHLFLAVVPVQISSSKIICVCNIPVYTADKYASQMLSRSKSIS